MKEITRQFCVANGIDMKTPTAQLADIMYEVAYGGHYDEYGIAEEEFVNSGDEA